MRLSIIVAIFLLCTATISIGAGLPNCADVSMTISSDIQDGGLFDGLHKYTVTGSWDTGSMGLSHIDFLFDLADCPCICDGGVIQFDDPAGSADGEPDPCTVLYTGGFFCDVDPSAPNVVGPGVKFDEAPGQTCESGQAGTGTWCFYSQLGPTGSPTDVHTGAVAIKFSTNVCVGDLVGTLPGCGDCPTSVQAEDWSRLKSRYR